MPYFNTRYKWWTGPKTPEEIKNADAATQAVTHKALVGVAVADALISQVAGPGAVPAGVLSALASGSTATLSCLFEHRGVALLRAGLAASAVGCAYLSATSQTLLGAPPELANVALHGAAAVFMHLRSKALIRQHGPVIPTVLHVE